MILRNFEKVADTENEYSNSEPDFTPHTIGTIGTLGGMPQKDRTWEFAQGPEASLFVCRGCKLDLSKFSVPRTVLIYVKIQPKPVTTNFSASLRPSQIWSPQD